MTTLSPDIEQEIQQLMATGRYESVDQLLMEALEYLKDREAERKLAEYLRESKESGVVEHTPNLLGEIAGQVIRELEAENAA